MQSELLGHCPSEDWGPSCLLAVVSLADVASVLDACLVSFPKDSVHKDADRIISTLLSDLGEKIHHPGVSGVYNTCLNDSVGLGSTQEPLCRQTLADRETAGTATKAVSTTTAGRRRLSMGLGATRVGKQWFQEGPNSLSCCTLKIHFMWISIGKLFKLTLLSHLK